MKEVDIISLSVEVIRKGFPVKIWYVESIWIEISRCATAEFHYILFWKRFILINLWVYNEYINSG